MTTHPLPLIDGALFVDNSMIELLTTCPRALEYNKLFSRVSAAEKPSLNFGSAIHEALEWRYVNLGTASPTPVDEEQQALVLTQFFDHHPGQEGDYRTLNWAIEVMRRYNRKYEIEPFGLLQYDKPIACPKCDPTTETPCLFCNGTRQRSLMVELPFALPLYLAECQGLKIPVIYTGRVDLPTVEDGAIWVTDHKTTSMLGQPFFERLRMSAQLKGYAWAFEQLTGKKVAGYRVNAIRVKEPPLSLSDGKSSAIEKWWNESLARERYYVTSEGIAEWKGNAIALVEEFFWHYSRGYFPMKTAWCTQFGRCPYFDVCSLPPGDRGVMISSGLFVNNQWSPLNQVKNENKTKQQSIPIP